MNRAIRTLAALSLLAIAGCVASDPYRPYRGGVGFSDAAVAPDVYDVYYEGKSSASLGLAQRMALVRAAEIALQKGRSHFVVLSRDAEQEQEFSATPGLTPGLGIRSHGIGGDPYYGTGVGGGIGYYGGYGRYYDRPVARLRVRLLDGPQENAFDAREVFGDARADGLLGKD